MTTRLYSCTKISVPTLIIALAFMLPGMPTLAETIVPPESPTIVEMSNTDVNRVVCTNGVINDAVFSADKGVVVDNIGSSSFVKFLIMRDGVNPDVYVTDRTEIYFVCDGVVYTLIAKPSQIMAKTIRLSAGTQNRLKKNLEEYGPQVEEDRAVSLSMSVMKDELSESYQVTQTAYEDMVWYENVIPNSNVAKRRVVKVEGIGFELIEYWIVPFFDINLDEGMLLKEWFGKDIFSITLDSLDGFKDHITRAFVINRK